VTGLVCRAGIKIAHQNTIALLLLLAACSLFFFGCGGGGGGGESVAVPLSVTSASIDSSGNISASLTGLRLTGSDFVALPAGRLEIRMTTSVSDLSGYVPAGSTYELTFYDSSGNKALNPAGQLIVTLAYNPVVLERQGADPSAIEIIAVDQNDLVAPLGGTVTSQDSSVTAMVSTSANPVRLIPAFARNFQPVQAILPLIELAYQGYKTALLERPAFIDPRGTQHPDRAKGRTLIQVGERALLTARLTDATGNPYTSFTWQLVAKPVGSIAAIILSAAGNSSAELVADVFGDYLVQLTAISPFSTDSGSYTVKARSYISASICVFCHDGSILSRYPNLLDSYGRPKLRNLAAPWQDSKHGTAFEAVKDSTSSLCMDCHTTGFLFADRDGNGTDDFLEAHGYDDFLVNVADWNTPAFDRGNGHLRSVTCESCHGPGSGKFDSQTNIPSHQYKVDISAGPCLGCHEIPDDLPGSSAHPQNLEDFHFNAHKSSGGIVMKNDPCFQCHVGQAFLSRVLNNGVKIGPSQVADPKGVTCAVCHDPHGEINPTHHYLRLYGATTIRANGQNLTVNAGKAAVCYNCHNANNALPDITVDPHGNESLMVEGVGGYDYGDATPVVVTHGDRVTDKCVTCHMTTANGTTHRRRLFEPDTGVYNTAGCLAGDCHLPGTGMALPTTGDRFNFNGKRAEIAALMAQLQVRINSLTGHSTNETIRVNYTNNFAAAKLTAVNRAAYNYQFVFRDGSVGVHNYPYAKKLLNASLNDLQGY